MSTIKNRKFITDILLAILLIIFSSLLLYIYSSKNIEAYNLINYYLAERFFYQLISILIIVIHVYIILRIVLDYIQMKQYIIFRIGSKYYFLIFRQILICLFILLVLHISFDYLLFKKVDYSGICMNTLCEFLLIPILTSKKVKKYNFVLGLFCLYIMRIIFTAFL